MAYTRRAFVAGLAALPLATTTAAASVDPIYGAITRYRIAWVALEAASPAAHAGAERSLLTAYEAVLTTTPQTIAGCRALVDFMIEDADAEAPPSLERLRRALDRLI